MSLEINNILNSDLLERYVLGDVSALEIEQVESLRNSNPAIKEALDKLELSLENAAIENKVNVPLSLKGDIIQKDYAKMLNPQKPKLTSRGFSLKQLLPYAAMLVLIGLVGYQKGQSDKYKSTIANQEQSIERLQVDCDRINQQFAYLNDPNTEAKFLTGSTFAPDSEVLIYWNKSSKQCLLKVGYLPNIDGNKTYQLWADVDGEMLSLGTFDHQRSKLEPVYLDYLDNVESLNITVEDVGGSKHPDVSTLSASVII